MKKLSTLLILLSMITIGCSNSTGHVDHPPEAPAGLLSVTGDRKVTLYWDRNLEPDMFQYALYTSDEPDGVYVLDGTTTGTSYQFRIGNGVTKYLAVAAIDLAGNESDLSYETVWDTPRPEGHNFTVYALFDDAFQTNFERCALDFSDYDEYMIQSLDNLSNDVYVDNFEGALYLNAFAEDTDVFTFGPVDRLSDVDFVDADNIEWNTGGFVPLNEDYAYLIWTHDNHFAVIKVREVYFDRIVFDWAYQTDPGNPQLKVSSTIDKRFNLKNLDKKALTQKLQSLKKMKDK